MPFFKTLIASLLLAIPVLASPHPYPSQVTWSAEPHATIVPQATPYTSPEPVVSPVKTPCAHPKQSPFITETSPEPVVDPIYTPIVESPEPVVDPIYTPPAVESPEPAIDPIYTPPVQSPEPVVDPIYTPSAVASPEPVVDPIYTPPVVESPEPVIDPIATPVSKEHPAYTPEGDDDDDVHTTPVRTPAPAPHKKFTAHEKPVSEEKEVGHCYLRSVDFGKYTAEQCCEVRYSCDSPHCAHSYACKHNPDVCHCHKVICKKIYLLASYKPVDKLHSSCSDDVFALH